jgi:tetratricopeptide (TPR) repeat protein
VVQRKQASPRARKKASREEARAAEAGMFFPRLRQHAKWVFVFLALSFLVGFVVFGVGSGTGGAGLGDLLQGGSSSSGPSAGDARDKIKKNPNDAAAYKELYDALSTSGKQDEAVAALDKYVKLRPKDYAQMRVLGGLYEGKASLLRNDASQIQADLTATTGSGLTIPQTTKLGQALGQGQIDQEVSSLANSKLSTIYTDIESAYTRAASLYQTVARAQPEDALLQLQLGDTAYQARQTPLAVKAYKRYLKLAPEGQGASYAKTQIKQLESGAANQVAPG